MDRNRECVKSIFNFLFVMLNEVNCKSAERSGAKLSCPEG
jgi:hypothetical protein